MARQERIIRVTIPVGGEVHVVEGPKLPSRQLITEEMRAAQKAKNLALSHARIAARQLALPLQLNEGGQADEIASLAMETQGRFGGLATELRLAGVDREELLSHITKTYKQAKHPPSDEEAFDLARAFVELVPGFGEEAEERTKEPRQ